MLKDIVPPILPGQGMQPVRFLHSFLLGLFEHAARDMPEIFSEQIQYHGAPSEIGYNISPDPVQGAFIDLDGKIHLQETFLSYLWTVSYSGLVVFEELIARPQLEHNYQRSAERQALADDAEQLFADGLGLRREYTPWPIDELPNPERWGNAEDRYVEKSSAAFLQATVFVMLHEFGHFYLGHLELDAELRQQQLSLPPDRSKEQEQDADNFAIQTMMSGADWKINRATVTCGIVVGLCAILFLHNSLDGGSEHPDPQHRLHNALLKMELAPDESTYRYIAQRQAQVPVRQLCQTLRVSASAYYAWQRCQLPVPEPAWQVAVRAEFKWHVARYGTRRLRAELHAKGYPVGRWRIRRALAAAGLRAQQPRSFVPRTTDSDPNVRAAPNLLLGQPAPTAPNQVWVGDITYLPKQGVVKQIG